MIDCAYRGLHGMSLVGLRTFWWCGVLFIMWEGGSSSSSFNPLCLWIAHLGSQCAHSSL